jgi:Ca2+-binding RTX toxin-like protein
LTDSTPGTPAAIGDTFTVTLGTVDDNDGLPPLSQFNIIWQVEETPGAGDWVNIAHPVTDALFTGLTFTPTPDLELEGLSIRAVGSFTGNNGIPEVVMSAPTVALAAATVTAATEGDDEIFGTVGADMIDGLGGDDTIFGFAGNDIITGGAGSDLIDGGEGSDTAVFAGLIDSRRRSSNGTRPTHRKRSCSSTAASPRTTTRRCCSTGWRPCPSTGSAGHRARTG